MGLAARPELMLLAFAGTLAVYNLDRVRDLARDRSTAPLRSAFITQHQGTLQATALVAAAAGALAALRAGPRVSVVAALVLAVGLLHRRLKRIPFAKAAYIAGAWTAVVVGLPWALSGEARHVAWIAPGLFSTLLGNAVASSVRDEEAAAAIIGPARALNIARASAVGGLIVLLLAPAPAAALAPVAAATLAALLLFRSGERYGLLVLDGALGVGAALALAL